MDAPQFVRIQYPHGGRALISPARLHFLYASVLVAALATVLAFPLGLALFVVPLVARWSAKPSLWIGPRYLLIGDDILYYANVREMARCRSAGTLRLIGEHGRTLLRLERSKFPTNANKPAKIAANRAAKFDTVSDCLIECVQDNAPGVLLLEMETPP